MDANDKNEEMNPAKWVDDYADYLFSYAISRVKNREVVEDLIQETFLSALKAKEKFQFKSSVATWLTSILRNKIFDYYKKSKKSDLVLGGDDDFNKEFFETGGFGKVWADRSFNQWDFESVTETHDNFHAMLRYCLKRLSDFHQSVFTLKNIDGLDAAEVCKVLEISQSNYWVIVHRSKIKLRKCVQNNWFNKK